MSGTFPSDPAPLSVTIRSVSPTLVSIMQSLSRQARSRGGQRWGFTLEYESTTREEIAQVVGFCAAQRGQYESFTFSPPLWYLQGTGAGTPLVDGASQTGTSIDLKGFDPSETVVKSGDFIQFAGSTKVYMVKADADSDGLGDVTVELNTPLVESPAADAAVSFHTETSPLSFTVALAVDELELPGEFDRVYSLELGLVEVLG